MSPARAPQNALGAFLLTTSWIFFTTEMVAVRLLFDTLSVAQIGVFRQGTQALAFLPLVLWSRGRLLHTGRLHLHLLRSLSSVGGMTLFYLAFSLLTFALATTVSFMTGMFMMILAALFLGETIGPRRIFAVLAGFVGVIVAMRPGIGSFEPAMLIALASALVAAVLMIITRAMASTESRLTIMVYSSWLGLCLLGLPAAFLWTPLEAWQLPYLAVVGVAGTTGQFLMVGAFQIAEASALAPVDYLRLIFAVLAGYLVFSEVPDLWTWGGAAIIIGAVVYATHRERIAARQGATARQGEL